MHTSPFPVIIHKRLCNIPTVIGPVHFVVTQDIDKDQDFKEYQVDEVDSDEVEPKVLTEASPPLQKSHIIN